MRHIVLVCRIRLCSGLEVVFPGKEYTNGTERLSFFVGRLTRALDEREKNAHQLQSELTKLTKEVDALQGSTSNKIARSAKSEIDMRREMDSLQKLNKTLQERLEQVRYSNCIST